MATGQNSSKASYFALLDSEPKKKHKKGGASLVFLFPFLPEVKLENSKLLVVESTDSAKPLSDFSPFTIHRAIQLMCNDVHSIYSLRDVKRLLLVKNNNVAQKFIQTKHLVSAYKFKKIVDGAVKAYVVVLLTFNLYKIPNKIDIVGSKFFVREYFASPVHCKRLPVSVNCLLLLINVYSYIIFQLQGQSFIAIQRVQQIYSSKRNKEN